MIKQLPYIALLMFPLFGLTQKLEVQVSESIILVGQNITLTYTVRAANTDSLVFSPKKETIPAKSISKTGTLTSEGVDFEITDEFIDTFIVDGTTKRWVGQYVVTAWDSGTYILPGPSIFINDSSYTFDDITIACLLVDPIDGMDIYDIKEQFAELPERPFSLVEFLKKHWWWIAAIVLSAIVFLFLKFRKNSEEVEEEKPVSLKQRTLIAIEALETAKLWEKNQLKEHFVELSSIIRMYLTSRYEISLLEKTTYEAKLLLTQKGLNEETVEVIARILSESDMVKFAKSQPDTISILRVSTLAKQIVAETSPLEFDNVE